tara:strand:+ start:861 stop:1175 length:315 start_codon:yes stop_codon:yes gene_type:complete
MKLMKKTSPWVRILLGLSISFLIGACLNYIQGNLVVELKLYLRLSIAAVILAVLYIKEFKPKNNFSTALKDSYPYFIALYLVGLGTWVPMLLGGLLMIWDFGVG